MVEVAAENTWFYYFTYSDMLSDLNGAPLEAALPEPEAIRYSISAGDVRLVLFQSMLNKKRGRFYFLFWSDNPDLSIIDRFVTQGTSTDSDFKSSVKTSYQMTVCTDGCGKVWPTLIIPPGDPYPGVPGLLEEKIARSKFLNCPNCSTPFRQMVVKIYDIEEDT